MRSEPYRITEPLIVPASLDPDAVKIIRRLQRYGHEAYFVGGSVRDLSVGRIPKDFDIATSARPRQVKRLFRNSRIIGRRFKLVHVQFGDKIIEVSTFRRRPDDPGAPDESFAPDEFAGEVPEEEERDDLLIRRDNVFGTAEEDAVRRDFTINALFYDVADNVVIDYVGGADDLESRTIRTIGDPDIRFQEDPVRILRAMRFAARLDFSIDPDTYDAMIDFHKDLARCAAPRLTEELLRLLSCGNSRRAWELLDRTGALDMILPEIADFLDDNPDLADWRGHVYDQLLRYFEVVDDIDRGRRILSNPTLLSVLLVGPIRQRMAEGDRDRDPGHAVDEILKPFAARMSISRREAFRVKQILISQPRFRQQQVTRRRRRVKPSELVRREYFNDALTFFRIESEALGICQDELERWTNLHYENLREHEPEAYERAVVEAPFGVKIPEPAESTEPPQKKTRRRRNRRRAPEDTPEQQVDRGRDSGDRTETRSAVDEPRTGRRSDEPDDPRATGDDSARRGRRTRKSSRRGGQEQREAEAQRPAGADQRQGARKGTKVKARARGRGKGTGAELPVDTNSPGQRLEFDEVRCGPLVPVDGTVEAAPADPEAPEQVDVRWDHPLPTVGDPGPISVIQTGIDQTEKRGRRRGKKKKDAASRELSKEVSDQPALQAFKMSAGDPRGHEAPRPYKPRRKDREPEQQEKEKPFDPVADFEMIESIFNW